MDVSLILIKKDGRRKAFPLASGLTVIGRHPNCDLRIPLMDISRRHCQLDIHGGLFTLRDLGSFNGTFVNGDKIEEVRLKPGDHIQIGPITFVLEVGEAAKESTQPKPPAPASAKDNNQISDDDIFADFGSLEDLKSGSATEFPAEP